MKTVFTLLLATFFTSAFARNEGKLTISIVSDKNFTVYVDGRQFQDEENTFTLNNVRPGNHTIQVYRAGRSNNAGNTRNRNRNYDRRGTLVYSSTVYVRPAYHVDVTINRFGKALVDEKSLADRYSDWEDDDWNSGHENGYRQAMNDQDFEQLMQRIRNQWFGRMGATKDAIQENYFSVNQLRQVLQVFTTEPDRLELARLAYPRLVDRSYFRQLYDLFSYNGQSELDRFVRENRF